jgi:Tfp pilus assembly protein FimT
VSRRRGQSLAETLVVVGIIALIFGFLVPSMLMLFKAVRTLGGLGQ